tara:strand:+ start:136 stop:462 length:327 start_codon:yes stop_codon:yes gene_type:complete
MIELHYAEKELKNNDPLKIEVKNLSELIDEIDSLCCGKSLGVVYLFATEGERSFLLVTESYLEIQELILSHKRIYTCNQFFLQEYDSYESAYSVALMMKETSALCYTP